MGLDRPSSGDTSSYKTNLVKFVILEASIIKKSDMNSGAKKEQNKSLVKFKCGTKIVKLVKKSYALLPKGSHFPVFFFFFFFKLCWCLALFLWSVSHLFCFFTILGRQIKKRSN